MIKVDYIDFINESIAEAKKRLENHYNDYEVINVIPYLNIGTLIVYIINEVIDDES